MANKKGSKTPNRFVGNLDDLIWIHPDDNPPDEELVWKPGQDFDASRYAPLPGDDELIWPQAEEDEEDVHG